MNGSIPKSFEGCNPVVALGRRHEDRIIRQRAVGKFFESTAHHEASFYRTIVKRSYLSTGDKLLLASFVNRWFRHGKPDSLPVSLTKLMDALGWCRNTVRKGIRRLSEMGLIVVRSAGVGRGNVTEYVVDLAMIQETLDPHASIVLVDEKVSCQGEIVPIIKGSFPPRAYRDNHNLQVSGRGRRWLALRFTCHARDRVMAGLALLDRIAQTKRNRWGMIALAEQHHHAKPIFLA